MFKDNFIRLCAEKNIAPTAVCKSLGLSNAAFSTWTENSIPRKTTLLKIADYFGVTVDYLMTGDAGNGLHGFQWVQGAAKKRLPLLGNVACGEPIWAEEEQDVFVETDSDMDADFCLTATGDSMIYARIFDGDTLFVKRQSSVNDGEIAVILIDNEATVKRVYYDRENNVLTLMPENPTFKPMRYQGPELDQITILGKVVAGQYKI